MLVPAVTFLTKETRVMKLRPGLSGMLRGVPGSG
jgi:hypothetical protein